VHGRTILLRIQTGLFLLCSVTYVVSLVYFGATLPAMIFTQVDHQGKPALYMEKGFLWRCILRHCFLFS
jgi:hypothetical protein